MRGEYEFLDFPPDKWLMAQKENVRDSDSVEETDLKRLKAFILKVIKGREEKALVKNIVDKVEEVEPFYQFMEKESDLFKAYIEEFIGCKTDEIRKYVLRKRIKNNFLPQTLL